MINHLNRLLICIAHLSDLSKINGGQIIKLWFRIITTDAARIRRDSNCPTGLIQKVFAYHHDHFVILVAHLIERFSCELNRLIFKYFCWYKYSKLW